MYQTKPLGIELHFHANFCVKLTWPLVTWVKTLYSKLLRWPRKQKLFRHTVEFYLSLLRRKRTPFFFLLRRSFLSGKLKISDEKIHCFSSRMTKEVMWTGTSNSSPPCQSLFKLMDHQGLQNSTMVNTTLPCVACFPYLLLLRVSRVTND